MSDPKSPLEQTQIPKIPPVVRIELPHALLLLALLEDVLGGRYQSVPVTNAQAIAVAKFQNRIREAQARDEQEFNRAVTTNDGPRAHAVGIFAEVLRACTCPLGLPPLEDCPVHGGGAS
jgi:hypothetical protein